MFVRILNNQKEITSHLKATQLIAVTLALTSATFFALGTITIRKGLDESNFISGTLVTTIIGTVIFWMLVPITVPLNFVDLNGILLFVLSGATNIGFTRLLVFRGMKELGASMNSSILATSPMISSLIAILLLGEQPTLGVWIGMIIVVSGIVMIRRSTIHQSDTMGKVSRSAFIYPLVAVCFTGTGFVVRKMALNIYDEPLMGVATGYLTSLFIYLFLSAFSSDFRGSIEISKRTFRLFWKGGLSLCFGLLCMFYAFRYGDVSVITPLLKIDPLFVLFFAHMFLKKQEKVTSLLSIGAVMIVTGVALITTF